MLSFTSKFPNFLSSVAHVFFGKYLQNITSIRGLLQLFVFLTERLPKGTPIFSFLLKDWESTYLLLKRKKVSFGWRLRSQAGCSHHLTIKYPCFSFPFSFWVHSSVILWETTKDIYIIQLSAKVIDILRRTELMFLAFNLQQKEAFNFQWGFFCKSLFYSLAFFSKKLNWLALFGFWILTKTRAKTMLYEYFQVQFIGPIEHFLCKWRKTWDFSPGWGPSTISVFTEWKGKSKPG